MTEIRRMTSHDRPMVMEHMKQVHSDAADVVEKVIFGSPFYSNDNFALVEEEGKAVAFTGLLLRNHRFGRGQIRSGEIAVVGTLPDYRRRGYASRLMNYWIDYMTENQIPLSHLFGIGGFYQQYGYRYAVPVHFYNYVEIEAEMLKEAKPIYALEPLLPEDIGQVAEIYEVNCRDNWCSEIRSIPYWRYRLESTSFGPHRWYVVKDGHQVKGYAWITETKAEICVREAGVADEEAAETISAFLYSLAQENGPAKIGLKTPQNHPLAVYLYRRGARFACNNEIFPGSWAGMYRINNLRAVLEAMTETLSERIAQSELYNQSGVYQIKMESDSAFVEIDRGRVAVIDRSRNAQAIDLTRSVLTPMVTGYKSVGDFTGLTLDTKHRRLLEVMFPLGYPYIWDLEMSEELC